MITLTVPPAFRTDRDERDLPVGETIKATSRGITIRISVEDARDYLSDAEYYADRDGPDTGPPGIKASARATLAPLRAALAQ